MGKNFHTLRNWKNSSMSIIEIQEINKKHKIYDY